jgi:hypothetical protein
MKLKVFTPETCGHTYTGKSTLNVNYGSGVFTFSKAAVEQLKINAGMNCTVLQDEARPKDWYLKFEKKQGFQLRNANKGESNALLFNNSYTAREIAKSLGINGNATYLIGAEPLMVDKELLWPIITSSAKQKGVKK